LLLRAGQSGRNQPPGTSAHFDQNESYKALFIVLNTRAASKSAWVGIRQLTLHRRSGHYFSLRCFEDVVLGIESPIAGDQFPLFRLLSSAKPWTYCTTRS